jgi:predicted DNA binding CopG/RHH family protein
MSRLPKEIRNKIREEAKEWDTAIAGESVEDVQKQLNEAELFKAQRPPRQPVSLRLDPFDISMIKRLARKKGIPYTQLMTLWLHEKVDQERKSPVSAP